jgi:dihydrofolate synthase/folylpolyglutamate synthase
MCYNAIMSIKETLKYIHSVKWQGSKPGLERTDELLAKLGNPEKKLKFVHVAGTNGKGSTSACIAAVLQQAGYVTGLYTSPYILSFNERMQVNGENITDDELQQMVEKIRPFADAMTDLPTEFEMITALAMMYFLHKKCDIVVLEVGLGGRLDSTNVIETPELAVITSIGFDHIKELGDTLKKIAFEKAGIIKKGSDVLIYDNEDEFIGNEITEVFEKIAKSRKANLKKVDFSRISKQRFSLDGVKFNLTPYGRIFVPLAGTYQPYNVTMAITALEILRNKGYKISDDDIKSGISKVKWMGRFEIVSKKPIIILDGAHNEQGIKATVESLKSHFGKKKIIYIVGVMADKNVKKMMRYLLPNSEAFFTVKPNNPRAMDAKMLKAQINLANHDALIIEFTRADMIACDSVAEAISMAKERAGDDGIICVLGSLYLLAEVKECLA